MTAAGASGPDAGPAPADTTDAGDAEAAAADDAAPPPTDPPGSLGALGALAAREFRVVHRAGWTVGLAVAFGLFTAGVVAFGAVRVGPARAAAVVASLAELAAYVVPLSALALGYGTVVGAAERGTLEPLFALPAGPATAVAGKLCGRAAALAGALCLGAAAGGALFLRWFGPGALPAYAATTLAALALGLAFLGLGALVSALAPEKSHALGGVLAVWAWFVLAHDLAALVVVAALRLPGPAVAALAAANPVTVFRVLARVAADTGAGTAATGLPPAAAAVAALAWVLVPAAAAVTIRRTPG